MPPSEWISLEGAKELEKALTALDAKVSRKIAGKALRAGAKPIEQEAKRIAPVKTGALRDAIKIVPGKNKKDYKSVKVAVGGKWFTGDQFYAAFQEFGWKTGKRGARANMKRERDGLQPRTQIEGRHYMEAAYAAKATEAVDAIIRELAMGIAGQSASSLAMVRAQNAQKRRMRMERKVARQERRMNRAAKRLRKLAKKRYKAFAKSSKRGFNASKKSYKALRRKFR